MTSPPAAGAERLTCPTCKGSGTVSLAAIYPTEAWVPVWWRLVNSNKWVKAIAGNPSRTGKTVKVRFYVPKQGQIERNINPKNLRPRPR